MACIVAPKCPRGAVKLVGIMLTTLLALFLLHQLLLPIIAYSLPTLDPTLFDWGVFGAYPTNTYSSFHLEGPQPRQMRWDEECDRGLVLLTPNGPGVARPGPMILDARGELVWMSDEFGASANLKVQRYRGEDYLTLWSGTKAATSGRGSYFMLDATYRVRRTVSAVGVGLFGDLHEFKITDQGTALLTVYNTTKADLTEMGWGRGANSWVVDNLFQEVDLETGELLFEWSAARHFDPARTYMTNPLGGYRESQPFDFYHLNSVDKDTQGNYIISSRHFHHVVCISPAGETLWILGGRDNQFTDLSNGHATNFKWQHDARWFSEEEGIISLFDNSKAGPLHSDAPESRAMIIQLDVEKKTARVLQSLTSLQGILASSQGSLQLLPGSNHRFVGWGSAAAFSEYSQDGALICEMHLGASWYYWSERMKSYRTTKTFDWHGMPQNPPQVKMRNDILSVSWNGATEVAFWALEGSSSANRTQEGLRSKNGTTVDDRTRGLDFEPVDIIPKTTFEGTFSLVPVLSGKAYMHFRVAALDRDHQVLRYSELCEAATTEDVMESSWLMTMFKVSLFVGFLVGTRFAFQRFRSAGHLRAWNSPRYTRLLSHMTPASGDWRAAASGSRSMMQRETVYEWVQMKWRGADPRVR